MAILTVDVPLEVSGGLNEDENWENQLVRMLLRKKGCSLVRR